jgi:hypothetical protein
MKPFIEWFVTFLVTILLFGWLQWGICWIFCETVIRDQRYFWPMMGIPMTFNMCFSLKWANEAWQARAAEKLKRERRGF